MKRKRVLGRLTGTALVLALLSSSMLSGTLAKYTSTVTGQDTAKVADFGFTLRKTGATSGGLDQNSTAITSFGIFDTAKSDTGIGNPAGGTAPVIIAPGSGGSFGFTFTNNSEVAVKTTYTVALTFPAGVTPNVPLVVEFDSKYYSDLLTGKVKVRDAAGTADSTTVVDIVGQISGVTGTSLSAALNSKISAFGPKVGTGTAPKYDYALQWYWAFEGATTAEGGTGTLQSDTSDTALGIATTKASPTMTITNKVDQLDNFTKGPTTMPTP